MSAAPALRANLTEGLASRHLPALDGLRAVGVFLVIFYHAGLPVPGGLGVLVFFVLSGFLITWLLLTELERYGNVSLGSFYIRRSLRIFPAFYVYALLLVTALLIFGKPIVWPQVVASLFYVNNYYQAIQGDPNTGFSHTWSLGIEEQFYLLWPALFLLASRRRVLVQGLIAAIALIWLHRLALVLVFDVPQSYIYEAFDTRADSLLVGCLLAALLRERRATRFFNWVCGHWTRPGLLLLLLVASVLVEARLGATYRDTVGLALTATIVAILIPQMIAFRHSVGAWLNWGWMRYLGVLSYSLYLYQQVSVEAALDLASHAPALFTLPIVVGVTVLCGMGSYYFVERPALRLKEKFSRI